VAIAATAACGDGAGTRAVSAPAVDAGAAGEGALRIAAADALDVAAVARPFTTATGCRVDVVRTGSTADLAARARTTGADLYSAPGEAVPQLVAIGAALPVPATVGNPTDVIAPLRDGAPATVGGSRYGVAYAWGADELIYARTAFPGAPPRAWSVLYDPAYAGRVAIPDTPLAIANAAIVQGLSDPYGAEGEDLAAAGRLLRHQRPLVREYWSAAADLGPLFADGRVVVGLARGDVAAALAPYGVASTVPAGPTTGWSEWFVPAVGAPHPRCAAKWLNYVAGPGVQIALADSLGGAPVAPKSCVLLGPSRCEAVGLGDEALLADVRFARMPPSLDAWRSVWLGARS
jgi:spermidine/putrescine-binding protein